MAAAQVLNQRIADGLMSEGHITAEAHQRAVTHVARHGGRIEDVLIEMEMVSEATLLKFVATLHGTRFVSTEKLFKAAIDPRIIAKVSPKLASLHLVFPVMWDEARKHLTVVSADPDNDLALQELKLASGAREIAAFVARPAAVVAAVARGYQGDTKAFSALFKTRNEAIELMQKDPFHRTSERPKAGVDYTPPPQVRGVGGPSIDVDFTQTPGGSKPPGGASPTAPSAVDMGGLVSMATGRSPRAPREATFTQETTPTGTREYLETLNVLVSLLESSRPDLRGHSASVARLMKTACERMALGPTQTVELVCAAYLHDLGKAGAYHLTALNVAEYDGHRVAAQKVFDTPIRLMEAVGLPPASTEAIRHMYERFDGAGFPDGQSGKEIALGARMLAIVDTYADLTQNPRNPYRKAVRPAQACDVLAQYKGTFFDPNLVDVFRQAMTGEDLKARLLADRYRVLIVDPDPEETTVLELRLVEQGFEVRIARSLEAAQHELQSRECDVVISEIDLDTPDAGLSLRGAALKEPWGREVLWIMLTRKTDREVAQIVFDLGVDDFVAKPASNDIFIAKLRQLLERRRASAAKDARGVSGSLAEMGLPEIVQILWHGRKTCALLLQGPGVTGQIFFASGQVVNALSDQLRGEEAFYRLMQLREGDFRLDTTYKPQDRAITATPEALLLEAMRRQDEAGSSGARA